MSFVNLIIKKTHKNGIMILLGLILFCIYISNIHNIYAINQIDDEMGYLSNAAFFSNLNWEDVHSRLSYYGYGYSLLLLPLFKFCKTGINIITGSIFINIICVISTYFIQICLMSKIFKEINLNIVSAIAFIVCLYPYNISSSMFVMCESFLVLMYWCIAYLLYKTLFYKQNKYFILLGLSVGFIFFVHTRSIIIIFTASLILVIGIFQKILNFKKIIIYISALFVAFTVFMIIKNYLIDSSYILNSSQKAQVSNLITVEYIVKRLKWLFNSENIEIYIITFSSKIFYILIASMFTVGWGSITIIKYFKKYIEDKETKVEVDIIMFFLFSFFLMVVACCVTGTGTSDNYASYFYGRYYEYLVSPIIFIGLYGLMYYNIKFKEHLLLVIFLIGITFVCKNLVYYLDSNQIFIDMLRASGLAYGVSQNIDFLSMINYTSLFAINIAILLVIIQKKTHSKCAILAIILCVFCLSNYHCITTINRNQQNFRPDSNILSYIDLEEGDIYFVNTNYKYKNYYSYLQVLLKDKKLNIIESIEKSNINENSYILTYANTELAEELKNTYKFIMEGNLYVLFKN